MNFLCKVTVLPVIILLMGTTIISTGDLDEINILSIVWEHIIHFIRILGISITGINVRITPINDLKASYDFIIVGAGSSGAVLASRLTEENFTVLLLEAGKTENAFAQVPLFAPLLQLSDYNWGYLTEAQENICLAMINQQCAFPRGKALGGSSVINYMIYTRGSRYDYKKFAKKVGDSTFEYENVLPYFKKSERVMLDNYDSKYHDTNGLLSISRSFVGPLTDIFIKAGEALGFKEIDYNGANIIGFSPMQATIFRGKRHSVAKAFLENQSARENLDIRLGSFATKILINEEIKEATGIEFVHKGVTYLVNASKEIIISSGAFNTPKLLMQSGIGPKEHLKAFGIKVIEDLPVGENLRDHLSYIGLTFLVNETTEPASQVFDLDRVKKWVVEGEGPLASLGGIEGIAYINSKRSYKKLTQDREDENPDIELIFVGGGSLSSDYGVFNRRLQRITDNFYYDFFKPNEGTPAWTIFPMLLHPKSKGKLLLKSTNPFDAPRMIPNFLSHPEDRATLIRAIKFILRLAKTSPFQKYDTKLSQIPIPQCRKYLRNIGTPPENDQGYESSNNNAIFNNTATFIRYELEDEYWNCALEYLTVTLHHQVGTCKMSKEDDPSGVVLSNFKVKNFNNLRVVDTSVIPMPLTAHTNAPAIMLGEKAADIIKNTYYNH